MFLCVTQACLGFCNNQLDLFLHVKQIQLSFRVYSVLLTFWSSKDLFEWTLNGTDHSSLINLHLCFKSEEKWNDMSNAILYNVIEDNSVLCYMSLGGSFSVSEWQCPCKQCSDIINLLSLMRKNLTGLPKTQTWTLLNIFMMTSVATNKLKTPLYAITLIVFTEITGMIRPVN